MVEFEPRLRDQVEALNEFEKYDKALENALTSLDTDLINMTLIKLKTAYLGLTASHFKLFELLSDVSNRVFEKQALMDSSTNTASSSNTNVSITNSPYSSLY